MQEILYAAEPSFVRSYLEERINARPEDIKAARELFPTVAAPGSPEAVDAIYSRDGEVAIIRIEGPLSIPGPDAWDLAYGYGGASYDTIASALARAQNDPSVKRVEVHANTPGGTVDGADSTWRAFRAVAAEKTLDTIFSGMLASAGIYITAPSTHIYGRSPTDEAGSVGVICAGWDFSEAYAEMGVKRVVLTSKNAPKKAARFDTKAGRDAIQERIDAAERIFFARLAEGRGVTMDHIIERFGQGALLPAQDPSADANDAIRAGMIDGLVPGAGFGSSSSRHAAAPLAATPEPNPAEAGNKSSQEVHRMNLSEFLAQGPAAVAEIDKIKADAAAAAVAPLNARIAKAGAILGSDAYAANVPVRKKAIECLEGKISVDALDGVVGMADMLSEQTRQGAAEDETAGQGATKPQGGPADAKAQEAAERKVAADGIASFFKKEGK